MSAGSKRATCPICRRRVAAFMHRRRLIFTHHDPTGFPHDEDVCEGSGWIVEDEDLTALPRSAR